MAEGVSELDGKPVDVGEGEKGRPPRPPDDPVAAPKGWIYDAKAKKWRPAKRVVRRPAEDGQEDQGAGTEPPQPSGEWDPDPARFAGETGGGRSSAPVDPNRPERPDKPVTLSDADKEEMKSLLALAGLFVFTPIANADPYCGGALVDHSTEIFEKLIPIIAKSERVTKWMTTAGGFGDWLGLAAALKPVAIAVAQHHVFKTVGHEDEDEEDLSRYGA